MMKVIMLTVTYKPFMLSVDMLNVAMLNVMAPLDTAITVVTIQLIFKIRYK
jgi:hypothetical protein